MLESVTVLEAIKKSAEFLEKKGVDSARLNAELLLAHVLKLPRMRLYLTFEKRLADAEVTTLRGLVVRRGQREPVQQILGTANFCGLELDVNRHVLVPRPETEVLAETAFELLKGLAATGVSQPSVLDVGTGSGCLAIAIARAFTEARVVAVDVSPEALSLARENAVRHGLGDRISFLESNLFSVVPPTPPFDLIVSNPPYIPDADIGALQPEVRDFEPRAALDGGPDGLDFYRRLAVEAPGRLSAVGVMCFEFGDGQAADIGKILAGENWIVEPPREDYTRRQRVLIARRK
jgi:release factor glutamine methyltransferase